MKNIKLKKILLIDDNITIHEDFYKILRLNANDILNPIVNEAEENLFGLTISPEKKEKISYLIDSTCQGEEALVMVRDALHNDEPYALAFVDIRMPSGWDGIITIKKIWEVDPDIQIVVCSAYSDYSWEEISILLHHSDNFLILKKPFEVIEVRQLASVLTRKWELQKRD